MIFKNESFDYVHRYKIQSTMNYDMSLATAKQHIMNSMRSELFLEFSDLIYATYSTYYVLYLFKNYM